MGLLKSIKRGFSGYFDFRNRASRSEYWWWILFCILGSIVFSIVDLTLLLPRAGQPGPLYYGVYDQGIVGSLFNLVVLIPSIAVACRRLHDIDRSGWWQLIGLIPLVGWIILLIWFSKPGDHGANRFGLEPAAAY